MEFLVERVDVWAATIPDEPGGLANMLSTLQQAGADLQSIIARRAAGEPGKGVVFVTPLAGAGINLSGFSGSVLNGQFIVYVALDSLEDSNKAIAILETA